MGNTNVLLACALACASFGATAQAPAPAPSTADKAGPVPVDAFVARDEFEQIKISPDGKYLAATVPLEDRSVLVILRRSDMQQTGMFNMRGKTYVADFWWVNDERVVLSVGEKEGTLDRPEPTGELAATNADGSRQQLLFGYRVDDERTGSNIKGKKAEYATGFVVDTLRDDDKNILISVWPWQGSGSVAPSSELRRLDVYSGRTFNVARAPVPRAEFVTDAQGRARFAAGSGSDNLLKTYYRDDDSQEWTLINDQAESRLALYPLALSADGKTGYLRSEEAQGPDAIHAFDTATRQRRQILRDKTVNPFKLLYSSDGREPIGALLESDRPHTEFFDADHPQAKLQRTLQASFGGDFPAMESFTKDGKLGLIRTVSDRNPGDYYLFDLDNKKASFLISRSKRIDPARMAQRKPVTLKARDGLTLHGYLTVPAGGDGKRLPLVVHPHGGPIGIADTWAYDVDSQLMASRGYAVMQINYRGSGNYGRAFERAGYRQWGRAMQDDLTDATRWAIDQGMADPQRICIYGASYGGYASLMGVAKEPALYRCAIGYVGVYDLKMMYGRGDIQQTRSGINYMREILGEEGLDQISPTRLADRIKVPVFLAAGGEDERAPVEHTRQMEKALKSAGVPVETLIYHREGHGFYTDAHRREYYVRLLAFLDRHIGPSAPAAPATQAGAP